MCVFQLTYYLNNILFLWLAHTHLDECYEPLSLCVFPVCAYGGILEVSVSFVSCIVMSGCVFVGCL